MKPINIVIIEDDPMIIEIVRLYLEREGYSVHSSVNAEDGLPLLELSPDVLLLDIQLPDSNGFDIARHYREISDGILIFITGEKEKANILRGFDIGCDDYITKPFHPQELIARVKAHLRRFDKKNSGVENIGNLTLNFEDMSIYKNGKEIELFKKEKLLLFFLAKNRNRIFSAEQLFDAVWGFDAESDIKTVSVHIRTLRKKIEDDPGKPKFIQTVRGFGYKFSDSGTADQHILTRG